MNLVDQTTKMHEIIDHYYDMARNKAPFRSMLTAKSRYNVIRDETIAAFPEKHCNLTDPWLYSEFYELYKDEYGVRPKGLEWTYDKVNKWMNYKT